MRVRLDGMMEKGMKQTHTNFDQAATWYTSVWQVRSDGIFSSSVSSPGAIRQTQ